MSGCGGMIVVLKGYPSLTQHLNESIFEMYCTPAMSKMSMRQYQY